MLKRRFLDILSGLALMGSVIAAMLLLAVDTAAAAQWPERPVRLIVPYAPGGSNDVIARKLAAEIGKNTGQTFIIENKAGAGGVVGSSYVASSAPDGYTFLFISNSLATSAAVHKTPYNARTAFDPISLVATAPFVIFTRKDFPAQNITDFIKYAKNNPGAVSFGGEGLGATSQMTTELFAAKAGIKMQAIGYKGISPAVIDLVAGRVDMMTSTLASIRGTPADMLPKLAFTGAQREPDFPDVPTIKEATGLDFVTNVWWGVFSPKGIDPAIRDKFNAAIKKVILDEDFAKFLKSIGTHPQGSTSEELQKLLELDLDRFAEIVKSTEIQH